MKGDNQMSRYFFGSRRFVCALVLSATLSCSFEGFDLAGGPSDIGNSQAGHVAVPDSSETSKEVMIIDLNQGVYFIDSSGTRINK